MTQLAATGRPPIGLRKQARRIGALCLVGSVLVGCGWWEALFDREAATSTSTEPAALSQTAPVAPPSTTTSGPQRGLLIETPEGPVPAQFTARMTIENPSRCARLNNYWCIKSPTGGGKWDGQIGEDSSGHAYFQDPVYSARAFARTLRSYYFRRDIKSVSGIINRYAPSSDCIGSLTYCAIDGATVRQHSPITGTGRIGSKYVSYTDTKPDSSLFVRSNDCNQTLMYCPRGRNQSEDYARDVARLMGTHASSNLNLFDDMGRLHYSKMLTLMKAIAKWELGNQYSVDEALIREGMIMEVTDFRESDPAKWPGVQASAFNM